MTKAITAFKADLPYCEGYKNTEILQTLTSDELTAVCLADDIVRCYGEGLDSMLKNNEAPWMASCDVVETSEPMSAFNAKSAGTVNGFPYAHVDASGFVSVVDLGDRRIVVKA